MIKQINIIKNIRIESWTYKDLIKNELYIGYNKRRWNPVLIGSIYKVVNKIHIINLEYSSIIIKKSLNIISNIIRNRGQIIIGLNIRNNGKIIEKLVKKTRQPYIKTVYYAGGLTNYKSYLEKYIQVKVGKGNHKLKKKIQKQVEGLKISYMLPGAVLIMDVATGQHLINECYKLGIPSIGIVNTNASAKKLTYTILSNIQTEKNKVIMLLIMIHAIYEGIRQETQCFFTKRMEYKKKRIIK